MGGDDISPHRSTTPSDVTPASGSSGVVGPGVPWLLLLGSPGSPLPPID
jgi:hypothetical protein